MTKVFPKSIVVCVVIVFVMVVGALWTNHMITTAHTVVPQVSVPQQSTVTEASDGERKEQMDLIETLSLIGKTLLDRQAHDTPDGNDGI